MVWPKALFVDCANIESAPTNWQKSNMKCSHAVMINHKTVWFDTRNNQYCASIMMILKPHITTTKPTHGVWTCMKLISESTKLELNLCLWIVKSNQSWGKGHVFFCSLYYRANLLKREECQKCASSNYYVGDEINKNTFVIYKLQ